MRIDTSGTTAYLEGDWTCAGMTHITIESLAVALQQVEHGVEKKLQIDCRGVSAIDSGGRLLLDVWRQCARFRGVESELIM